MKNKASLERLAQSAGGTLEEDHGYRDMRVFQIVAPERFLWASGGVTCVRLDWARGSSPESAAFNEAEYLITKEALDCGLEPMTDEQLSHYEYV